MSRKPRSSGIRRLLAGAALALVLPAAISAQGGDGFLFKTPRVSLKFETGYAFQMAGSDIFDFVVDSLTVDRRDFDSPYVGGEFAFRVSERLDVAVGIGYQQSSVDSEFRFWVDADDNPIEQVTELRLVPVMVSAKYYVRDRGRSVGRFAWIPTRFSPYVGGGIGLVSYRFEQVGDFVDSQDFGIFYDDLLSEGEAPLVRALAGLNFSLGKQFLFTAEARYGWASAELSRDFSEFSRMDLDGLQLVGGIGVRF